MGPPPPHTDHQRGGVPAFGPPKGKAGYRATFHDLRHAYASLLIAKGSSVKTVQRRLGHQSAMETRDAYSHL